MSLITELHQENEIEIINQDEYDQLDEGAQRAFRRVANNITQYYRCTSGPKKGKLASDPSKCGQRKDPAKVRHGRRVAKQKGSVRVRKTIAKKRTQVSKRVTKLNQVLKSRRAGGKRKMKKVGESFTDYLMNAFMIQESESNTYTTIEALVESVVHSEGEISRLANQLKIATDLGKILNEAKLNEILQSSGYNDSKVTSVNEVRYRVESDTDVSLIVSFDYPSDSGNESSGTVVLTNDGKQWNADF